MWWYRDGHAEGRPEDEETGDQDQDPVVSALRTALQGRPRDPDCLLAMSLLVDSRIEAQGGAVLEGVSWGVAEQMVQAAYWTEVPVRLYNDFAKDFGDGYTKRPDLPADHREVLDRLRASVAGSRGIVSVQPRG